MGDVINLQDYRKRLAGRDKPARRAKTAQGKAKGPKAKAGTAAKPKPVAGEELRLKAPAEPAKTPDKDQPDS